MCWIKQDLLCISGGVLVFTTNSLLYLNQSVPPYGVSLNSIAESSTSFPLSKYPLSLSAYLSVIFLLYTLYYLRHVYPGDRVPANKQIAKQENILR